MIFGMSLHAYTVLHVIISLIAIVTGSRHLAGMLGSQRMPGVTALFLATTILTSVTGFLFPINGFTPALGVGVVSLVILAIALLALYGRHLAGAWRWIYVVSAVAALWFNVFVLVVQAFEKVASLHALATERQRAAVHRRASLGNAVLLRARMNAAFKFGPTVAVRLARSMTRGRQDEAAVAGGIVENEQRACRYLSWSRCS